MHLLAGEGKSLWAQNDGDEPFPSVCTGFMAIKNTLTTRKLMQAWVDLLDGRQLPNQPFFNEAASDLNGPNTFLQ